MWNPFKISKEAEGPRAGRLDEILDDYAKLLSNESNPWLMDESCLPATKKEVKLALVAVLANSASDEERERWRCCYLFLASFLPGVGREGVRGFDAQDYGRLSSQLSWVEKFDEESNCLKAELKEIKARLRTDELISVLRWLDDLKP